MITVRVAKAKLDAGQPPLWVQCGERMFWVRRVLLNGVFAEVTSACNSAWIEVHAERYEVSSDGETLTIYGGS